MIRPILKNNDWSLNLEDSYYEENRDEIILESLEAVAQTGPGYYVNIVTPEKWGDPRQWLTTTLQDALQMEGISTKEMTYIDQCGCGGYVLRVYR